MNHSQNPVAHWFLSLLAMAALAVIAPTDSAQAAVGGLPSNTGKLDLSPNWEKLRPKLFGERPIFPPPSQIQIEVPRRATFGGAVPVRVSLQFEQDPALFVKHLYLVIDNNPSPLAAKIDLTPTVGRADFETRVRIDTYSHVRAIAEMSDGQLHMDVGYVKTSGGCSAPPNRERPEDIGKILLKTANGQSPDRPDKPVAVDFKINHPNDTGFELNHQTVMFIPPNFIRDLDITYQGQKIWSADLDFSISENPYFRINVIPGQGGELRADAQDTKGEHYTRTTEIVVSD
ncbi:MAG: quinoprotein dehydrogenase-associated SoxYZ-like carrier [Burkholderiaceae bacterium]